MKTMKAVLFSLFSMLLAIDGLVVSQAMAQTTIDRSELVNVDAQTDVTFSGIFTNRRQGTSTTNGSIGNSSATSIPTPLILVVESISDPSVTVSNADGTTTPDGQPFFNVTGQVPGAELDPGESTSARPFVFDNPSLVRFTVETSVFQQTVSAPMAAVTIEVPADSLGRKFVGVGDGVILTVSAEGTAPVVVELGQQPAGPGSRGVVFYEIGRASCRERV